MARSNSTQAAVAIDEDRLRETLTGMSLKNASEDIGFGRFRRSAQRFVEALSEQRRAHADLVRASAKRQIAFEPQMLNRQADDAEDRNRDAEENRRGNPPPADHGRDRASMRAFERRGSPAGPRPSEAKRRFAADPPSRP